MKKEAIIILVLLIAVSSFFVFYEELLIALTNILFIIFIVLNLYAIIIKNSTLFLFVNLTSVPMTELFSFNEIVHTQSAFFIIIIIAIIRYNTYTTRLFNSALLILLILILLSIYKSSFKNIINYISSMPFMLLIPLFAKMNIKSESLIRISYIPLVFIPLYVVQISSDFAWGSETSRIMGYVNQANGFGLLLVINLAIVVARYLVKREKFDLYVSIFYFILVLLTQSRMGLVVSILVIYLTIILFYGKMKIKLNSFFILLLFIGIGYFIMNSEVAQESRYTEISVEGLEDDRAYIWKDVIRLIDDDLYFGIGMGNYDMIINDVKSQRSTHNSYLSMIVSVGIVGMTVQILFLLWIMHKSYKRMLLYQKNMIENDFIISIATISAFAAILLGALTNSAAFSSYVSLLLFILIGYIYNRLNQYKKIINKN